MMCDNSGDYLSYLKQNRDFERNSIFPLKNSIRIRPRDISMSNVSSRLIKTSRLQRNNINCFTFICTFDLKSLSIKFAKNSDTSLYMSFIHKPRNQISIIQQNSPDKFVYREFSSNHYRDKSILFFLSASF